MLTLPVSDFKARCLDILNMVHDSGQAVIVTRRGKPWAKIVPLAHQQSPQRQLGALAGEAVEHGDIVHGGFARDWESTRSR